MLVILTDMTNYCEALREVSASKGEIPSRKGYPGLHVLRPRHAVRARRLHRAAAPGTLTQLSILTMPADDIGHPIPDLTGYITEGQIVLVARPRPARHLPADQRAAEPVAADEGRHRRAATPHADHPALASQLFAAYARAVQARVLASVVGEEGPGRHRPAATCASATASSDSWCSQDAARTLEESMDARLAAAAPACRTASSRGCPTRRSRATSRSRPMPESAARSLATRVALPRTEGRAAAGAGGLRPPRREVPAAGHARSCASCGSYDGAAAARSAASWQAARAALEAARRACTASTS